jgi:hypothetical protein
MRGGGQKNKTIGRAKSLMRGGGHEEEVNRQGEESNEGRRSGRRSQ